MLVHKKCTWIVNCLHNIFIPVQLKIWKWVCRSLLACSSICYNYQLPLSELHFCLGKPCILVTMPKAWKLNTHCGNLSRHWRGCGDGWLSHSWSGVRDVGSRSHAGSKVGVWVTNEVQQRDWDRVTTKVLLQNRASIYTYWWSQAMECMNQVSRLSQGVSIKTIIHNRWKNKPTSSYMQGLLHLNHEWGRDYHWRFSSRKIILSWSLAWILHMYISFPRQCMVVVPRFLPKI